MVKECKLIEPIFVEVGQTAQDAAKKIDDTGLRQVYVCDNGKPVGIISISDINKRVVAEGKDPSTKVEDFMTKDILVIEDETKTLDAYREMNKRGIGNVPVIDEGNFIGILSINEALAAITNPNVELQ